MVGQACSNDASWEWTATGEYVVAIGVLIEINMSTDVNNKSRACLASPSR